MQTGIYHQIKAASEQRTKQLAILIDPDKTNPSRLQYLLEHINTNPIDYILVVGSLLTGNFLGECISILKESTRVPVVLFPGNTFQIDPGADALLLLSLISGRNPELLIGNHVVAAPVLRNSNLEVISTGYMLIESGRITSVQYMSNTTPIPSDKTDIAICTAMAGEMLGMKLIYMEAGSGASRSIPEEMIRQVKESISIPLIVGGGIRCAATARAAWQAGADVLVVGNALETLPGFIEVLCREKEHASKIRI
jgi:phosphoglycerol geranylgeranyltransferase